ARPNDKDLPVQKVLNATSTGVVKNDKAEMLSPPDPPTDEIDPTLSRRDVFDVPEGTQVNESVVVLGSTGNSIIQLESALDRVTHEIAMNLKERKVLVVWMLDASASLQKQREVIAKRLKRIYGELDALKKAGQIPRMKEPLLTGVVSYGAATSFLTREPTADFETIRNSVGSVKVDESGRENVFNAVSRTLGLWGRYHVSRRILLVNVTDEAGDDFGMLERVIQQCRHYRARAYVIGPSAVFGRRQGYVPYVAPEDGKTYQIPVDLGPETARYENLVMPFWFSGPQYRYLSSGYGPYALSRLVRETGGIYFTTNTLTMTGLTPTGSYQTEQIKPFQPDYRFGSRREYEADLLRHPLRAAVVMAARLSRENKPEGTPALDLRVTGQNFRRIARAAQEPVARSQLFVDNILAAFPRGIEKELDKERSARWRMNFCLTYGRLLAMHVRCLEYNSACADLKSNLTPQDVDSTANHWKFRPDRDVNFAISERRNARIARELLERCIREAPGTPWAVLAKRELRHPLGIRVIKRFIPPPTPRKRTANNAPQRRRVRLAPDPRKPQPKRKPARKPKPKPKLPRY
ncbi:MAG: vWA domain-containing protein, partial [Planctomycetaceae bacterium]